MNKLTCFVAMVLAAVSAMALAVFAFAPRAFAQPASIGLTGVCCITNPISCIIVTEAECAQQGGIYGGDGSTCFLNPFGDCTCGPGAGNCTDPLGNGTPGCESLLCCEPVCLNDPACCDFEWDANCADVASLFQACQPGVCCINDPGCIIATEAECAIQGGIFGGGGTGCGPFPPNPFGACTCGPGAGSCTELNGTPGCESLLCCESVCSNDPFCCDAFWDQACVDIASLFQVCTCPWDCQAAPQSGAVDVPDLLALLAAWGGPQTPGTTCDLDGSGVVNVPDLLKLLGNWGPCP